MMGKRVPEGRGSNGEGPNPRGPMLGQSRGGKELGVCRYEVAVWERVCAGGQKGMKGRGCEGLCR